MDEKNSDPRPRASLRGKGPEILLGQQTETGAVPEIEPVEEPVVSSEQVDPAALPLTPDERSALLDFSPDSPAYSTALALPPADVSLPAEAGTAALPDAGADVPEWDEEIDEDRPVWLRRSKEQPFDQGVDDLVQDESLLPLETPVSGPRTDDAVPLAERAIEPAVEFPYQPRPELDDLIPRQPEQWPGVSSPTPVAVAPPEPVPEASRALVPGTASPDLVMTTARRPSPPARYSETDPAMLGLLVGDDQVRKLGQQIEALHEDLAQHVYGDREMTDAYQQELLHASNLLLASRENYDDARAIVYRVRTDMNRQRKAASDTSRYRPLLLNYYLGAAIALGMLFLLKALFTGVAEAVGVGIVSAIYYPMLLGAAGALVAGYLVLERHTTRLRDFDPLYISWYLFNPLLGGIMGLLVILLASIANEDLLRETATNAEYAIVYLLCVIAGMNQNTVLRLFNELLKRFGRGS